MSLINLFGRSKIVLNRVSFPNFYSMIEGTIQTASKRVINGWAMYDWANSVYNSLLPLLFSNIYFWQLPMEMAHMR